MAENTRNRKQKDSEPDGGNAALMNEIRALSAKMDTMQTTLETQISNWFLSLNERMEKLLFESQANMKADLENMAAELRANLDMEVGIITSRMERIETKIAEKCITASFEPNVSIIIVGLQQEDNEDVMAKVLNLLRNGLGCDPMPTPVAVERIRARGTKPGLIKVELSSVEEKVAVLRRKAELKDHECFQKVFVSSAKSHAERLVDLNFRTLLRETSVGKDFYLAANGRLVKRTAGQPRQAFR